MSETKRQPALSNQVFDILAQRISDGVYPGRGKLPSEHELSEEFEVSRATIRRALDRLVDRGLIQRKQGIGNFVTRLGSLQSPLVTSIDFEQRIADRGYAPGFRQLYSGVERLEDRLAEKLEVDPGSEAIVIHKLFLADDRPVIFIINHIPCSVISDTVSREQMQQPGFTEPFFAFFSEKCGIPIKHLNSTLSARTVEASQMPAGIAVGQPGDPLLMVEDIGYSANGEPVFRSLEFLIGLANSFDIWRLVDE